MVGGLRTHPSSTHSWLAALTGGPESSVEIAHCWEGLLPLAQVIETRDNRLEVTLVKVVAFQHFAAQSCQSHSVVDSFHKGGKHCFRHCSRNSVLEVRSEDFLPRLLSVLPNIFIDDRIVLIDVSHVDKSLSAHLFLEGDSCLWRFWTY